MVRALAFIATLIFGATALAQTVAVSAGEHGAYSRIVLSEGASGARVTQTGRAVEIRLPATASIASLLDLNERRKAHRVSNARYINTDAGPVLRLDLACDCTVENMTLSNGRTVIDVRDRTVATLPQKATSPTPASTAPANQIFAEDDDRLSVERAHNRMLELLQQAAREGLISVKTDEEYYGEDREGDQPQAPANDIAGAVLKDDEVAAAKPPAADMPPLPNVEKPVAQATSNTQPARACMPDGAFAFNADRFEDQPLVEISALQSALGAAEHDAQAAIAVELAEGFLSIGFGEEALAVLMDFGYGDAMRAEMARAVAEAPMDQSGIMLGARDCRGAHALWQATALEPIAAASVAPHSENAVSTLPTRLRVLVATRIAKKMIEAEAWSEAKRFFDIATEASEVISPDLAFVEAKLQELSGDKDGARETLLDLATDNSTASDDALLSLAKQYADGETPHDGFFEDIGALNKVAAHGASEASFLEAVAWANVGNIEASILLLESAGRKDEETLAGAQAKAREIIVDALSGDDPYHRTAALDAYLSHRAFIEGDGSSFAFRKDVAIAATALGLPNVAYKILHQSAASADKTALFLKAEAALNAGNPTLALATAAPHAADPDFAALAARANLSLDRNNAALAAASALPASEQKHALMAEAAWRAGQWRSALSAFQAMSPSNMDAKTAIRFALAAYMAEERTTPAAVEAVLGDTAPAVLEGVRSLFVRGVDGSVLARGKYAAASAEQELILLLEALGHG
ncbi:MAG: hypothetical protein AAGC77_05295 [Pseudomonadota bacterium]